MYRKGKGDDESADQQTAAIFFLERRNLKIPATGIPCVLTVGLSINITTFGE